MQLALVFLIGLVSSFLSNVSGGGGSLIMLPLLIHVGLSPLDAIGTIKVGSLGLVVGSAFSAKDKGIVRRDYLIPLATLVLIASIVGPELSLHFSQETVKIISSGLIVMTALASLVSWRLPAEGRPVSNISVYIGFCLYFVTTTLLGGFGSAVGLLSSYVLIGLLGMSALETTGTRRIVGLIGTPVQLILFLSAGHVKLGYGIYLMLGSILGSYVGLNIAFQRGNIFVKRAMAMAAFVLVGSLFL